MNKIIKKLSAVMLLTLVLGCTFVSVKAYAADTTSNEAEEFLVDETSLLSSKAWAGGMAIAIAAAAGAIAMAFVIVKTLEGVARQPEAEGKLRTTMMLGLVFVETAIIYALIVVILIIFVL